MPTVRVTQPLAASPDAIGSTIAAGDAVDRWPPHRAGLTGLTGPVRLTGGAA